MMHEVIANCGLNEGMTQGGICLREQEKEQISWDDMTIIKSMDLEEGVKEENDGSYKRLQ